MRRLLPLLLLLACGPLEDAVEPTPAPDACPDDPLKLEPGLCGCGLPDSDGDGDGLATCLDPDEGFCEEPEDCADGLDCTVESCEDGRCVRRAEGLCPWPAESVADADNLTGLEDPAASQFRGNLSGAAFDAGTGTLWVVTNGGPERVWALREGESGWQVVQTEAGRAEWEDGFGDLEALTLPDPEDPHRLLLLDEGGPEVTEARLVPGEAAAESEHWDLSEAVPPPSGLLGAEALAWVPDAYLEAQGFVDADGEPAASAGAGGLLFVGHQQSGLVYVVDLLPGGAWTFLGSYATAGSETAGLEFDPSTGLLWIFHGGSDLTLEAARLSSTPTPDGSPAPRRLDAVRVYDGPELPAGASSNLEGFAIEPVDACEDDRRDAFLTIDDGGDWSLLRFDAFPCR